MDWGFVGKAWEKWASFNVASSSFSSGEAALKGAILINYDPTGPSRLLSIIAEQEGIKANPIQMNHLLDFIKRDKLTTQTFTIAHNQYVVTSIHERWFCGRCLNTSKPAGEGAIVMQTAAFILVGLYDGSMASASRAMVAVDQFVAQLTRRNL
uniref:Profilin n=1 Tax=Cannabis sativa TaxID=3483 RepID=A0A803R8S1_CANSA